MAAALRHRQSPLPRLSEETLFKAQGRPKLLLNKLLLLQHMREHSIALATVSYQGGGDEGNTTGVELIMVARDGQNPAVDPPEEAMRMAPFWLPDVGRTIQASKVFFKLSQMPLEPALDETAWALVTDLHGGFYNGCGGSGQVRFHMDTQTVVVAHNDYYTASNFSETQV